MKSFDDLFTNTSIDNIERVRFTTEWLNKKYGLTQVNTEWVSLLSDVHDHDNQPKHFGQIVIGNSFTTQVTQLVKLPDGWHLGVRNPQQEEGTIIHPKDEKSWSHPENIKVVSQLKSLVKNGKVIHPEQQIQEVYNAPLRVEDNFVDIYQSGVTQSDDPLEQPHLTTQDVLFPKTKTVSIDF